MWPPVETGPLSVKNKGEVRWLKIREMKPARAPNASVDSSVPWRSVDYWTRPRSQRERVDGGAALQLEPEHALCVAQGDGGRCGDGARGAGVRGEAAQGSNS